MTARAPSITDTIVAVATGWRRTPRAVIRISGTGTRTLCQTLFEAVPGAGGNIVPTRFRLTDTLALPCLLIRYDGPRSYTGEDGAEMIVPGNPILLERIAARLMAEPGVREATPGEFSARAYLAGRLTLAQAEGVAALIGAETDDQLGAAAALMSGRSGERHRRWADEVAGLLALVEAGVDFTDQEDVVPIAPAKLATGLGALLTDIQSDLGAAAGRERPTGLPRVVLVGAPSAGKSTLFNALLGRGRAMVSPVAGTTRDAIVEELDLREAGAPGTTVELVDLAGLEPVAGALPEIDAEAQRQARAELGRADVLVLCDPRGRFDALEAIATNKPTIRVRTKADLLGHDPDGADGGDGGSGGGVIGVCSLDGWNLDTLRRAIADAATGAGHAGGVWLLPRHRRTLAGADGALRAAMESIDPTAPALRAPELVAGSLRSALDQLGELVGDIPPDEVIGRVFATFCVGK